MDIGPAVPLFLLQAFGGIVLYCALGPAGHLPVTVLAEVADWFLIFRSWGIWMLPMI